MSNKTQEPKPKEKKVPVEIALLLLASVLFGIWQESLVAGAFFGLSAFLVLDTVVEVILYLKP